MTETTCARHPKIETLVKCASCGTPICERCMVLTPVGYKCRACGIGHNLSLERPTLPQALAVLLVGVAGGALAGTFLGYIGFFALFLSYAVGRLLGMLIIKVSGGKSGTLMEILTGTAIFLGGIGGMVTHFLVMNAVMLAQMHRQLPGAAGTLPPPLLIPLYALMSEPFAVVILVIVIVGAISRLRLVWGDW